MEVAHTNQSIPRETREETTVEEEEAVVVDRTNQAINSIITRAATSHRSTHPVP